MSDELVRNSLAYRSNRDPIWKGELPTKYTRLLPHISGTRAFELGSAEGVLALAMVREGRVQACTGLELRSERHCEAIALRKQWDYLGYPTRSVSLWVGDIRQNLHLLQGHDTFVAVRSIYYLRNDISEVMSHVARHCGLVVLCGNRNRAAVALREPDTEEGRFNFSASIEGMASILQGAGYRAEVVEPNGDPVVIGRRAAALRES